MFSIFVAFGIATTAIITEFDKIDPETQTCRYNKDFPGFDWAGLLVLALPTNLAVLFCCVCYLSVIRKLKEFGERAHLELLLYPLILIICYFPFIFLRILLPVEESSVLAYYYQQYPY